MKHAMGPSRYRCDHTECSGNLYRPLNLQPIRTAGIIAVALLAVVAARPAAADHSSSTASAPAPSSVQTDASPVGSPVGSPVASATDASAVAHAVTTGSGSSTAPAGTKIDSLPPAVSPEEAKIGKAAVKEVEQEYIVIRDPALTAKLQGIVDVLVKATPYPDLHFTVTVVTSRHPGPEPEINAFSIPGGYIYVTRDLLGYVQSDDELAAVLGHEMAHCVHHHVIKQIKSEKHDQIMSLFAILGALLAERGHPGAGTAYTAMMAPQVVQALQSPHSIEDETQADMSGIDYMYGSGKYNPAGMLSFMESLASEESHHPEIELGYYQDHPSGAHRVDDIRAKLKQLHVSDAIRPVRQVITASAVRGLTDNSAILRIQVHENVTNVITFVDGCASGSAMARARAAASALNNGFDTGREMGLLNDRIDSESAQVLWEGAPIFTVEPADAAATKETVEAAVTAAINRIKNAMMADSMSQPVYAASKPAR